MNRRLVVLVFATLCFVLAALCSCTAPSTCKATWPADPYGHVCVNGSPVFVPPAWVQVNSPIPFANPTH